MSEPPEKQMFWPPILTGTLKCVLKKCQGGAKSAIILEKQVLLPINLVARPFSNTLSVHHSHAEKELFQEVHPKVGLRERNAPSSKV